MLDTCSILLIISLYTFLSVERSDCFILLFGVSEMREGCAAKSGIKSEMLLLQFGVVLSQLVFGNRFLLLV